MRITEGTILLVQPVLGRRLLAGPATIGTTWVDYTFNGDASADDSGRSDAGRSDAGTDADAHPSPRAGQRVLIPITNVAAVFIDADDARLDAARLPSYAGRL